MLAELRTLLAGLPSPGIHPIEAGMTSPTWLLVLAAIAEWITAPNTAPTRNMAGGTGPNWVLSRTSGIPRRCHPIERTLSGAVLI